MLYCTQKNKTIKQNGNLRHERSESGGVEWVLHLGTLRLEGGVPDGLGDEGHREGRIPGRKGVPGGEEGSDPRFPEKNGSTTHRQTVRETRGGR